MVARFFERSNGILEGKHCKLCFCVDYVKNVVVGIVGVPEIVLSDTNKGTKSMQFVVVG